VHSVVHLDGRWDSGDNPIHLQAPSFWVDDPVGTHGHGSSVVVRRMAVSKVLHS
jgi:hypothetical protein